MERNAVQITPQDLLQVLEESKILDKLMSFSETDTQQEIEHRVKTVVEIGHSIGSLNGALRTLKDVVLDILEERFGPIHDSIRQEIEGMNDTFNLKMLCREAGRIESIRIFEQRLIDVITDECPSQYLYENCM